MTVGLWLYHILYCELWLISFVLPFFFNDPATTEIYTLSLHDALPILALLALREFFSLGGRLNLQAYRWWTSLCALWIQTDRKSTRLNSSHSQISYAVFCLKKKNKHHSRIDHSIRGIAAPGRASRIAAS